MQSLIPRASGWLLAVFPIGLVILVGLGAGKRAFQRVPRLLLVSSLLFGLLQLWHRSFDWTLSMQLILMMWTFSAARACPPLSPSQEKEVWRGIVAGTVLLAVLAVLEVTGSRSWLTGLTDLVDRVATLVGVTMAPRVGGIDNRATLLAHHPNVLAAAVLVPTFAAMALRRGILTRLVVLASSVAILVLTGSRSAVLGLGAGLLVLGILELIAGRAGVRRTLVSAGALALTVVVVLATFLSLAPSATGRFIPGLAPVQATENLLQSSEDLLDGVWWSPFVDIELKDDGIAGVPEVWSLVRFAGGPVDRIQQRVKLSAGTDYVFSFEFARRNPMTRPGLVAWGSSAGTANSMVVTETVSREWSGTVTGAVEVIDIAVDDVGSFWTSVSTRFRIADSNTVTLQIGIAPDMAQPPGTTPLDVRTVQLREVDPAVEGELQPPYSPSYPPDRSALRASSAISTRLRVYSEAWRVIREHPLLGVGPTGFKDIKESAEDPIVSRVAHEHSLFLWAALRYGLVGMTALALMLTGVVRGAPRSLPALAAVIVANLFDITFWSAGVYLSLAVVGGFRTLSRDAVCEKELDE